MRVRFRIAFTLAAPVVGLTFLATTVLATSHPALHPASSGGYDVSWPQCSKTLPSGQAFGIVGVNGGVANSSNPCFSKEFSWAQSSKGSTLQPAAQVYVNTGNPGDIKPRVSDWPINNIDTATGLPDIDPYGPCSGNDDQSCSWQYGYNMASLDATKRNVPSGGTLTWWLDVETSNSWTTNTVNNDATLQAMTDYFENLGAHVGVYSTQSQWGKIAGSPAIPDLSKLDSWLPGARSGSGASQNCSRPPILSGGKVVMTQYTTSGLDHDVSCIN